MRKTIPTTWELRGHFHLGLLLLLGVFSVTCCCCLELCHDAEGGQPDPRTGHSEFHAHLTVLANVPSSQQEVADILAMVPTGPVFLLASDWRQTEKGEAALSFRLAVPALADLILKSSRLLI